MSMPVDKLSSLTHELLRLNQSDAYGELVPRGAGHGPAKTLLGPARAEQLVQGPPADPQMALAILSALWLWHDWLDESHRISQNLPGDTGSYWHAIMHRREGDFSNSKYWNARCRSHPALEWIGSAVEAHSRFGAEAAGLGLVRGGRWQPDRFVDLVEQAHESPSDQRHALAVELQRIEWRELFGFCAARASADVD